MAAQRVLSLRLNQEEEALVEQRARELGLYPHGLIKGALRLALGLPVPTRLEQALRDANRVVHT